MKVVAFGIGLIFSILSQNVLSNDSTLQVLLSWDAVPGAQGYRIQLSLSESFDSQLVDEAIDKARYLWVTHPDRIPKSGKVYYRIATLDRKRRLGIFSEPLPVPLERFVSDERVAEVVTQTVVEKSSQSNPRGISMSATQYFGDDRFLGDQLLKGLYARRGIYPIAVAATGRYREHLARLTLTSASWVTARSDLSALRTRGFHAWDLSSSYFIQWGAFRLGGVFGLSRFPSWDSPQGLRGEVMPYLGPELHYEYGYRLGKIVGEVSLPILSWSWKGLGGARMTIEGLFDLWARQNSQKISVGPQLSLGVQKAFSGDRLLRTQALLGVVFRYELSSGRPTDTI